MPKVIVYRGRNLLFEHFVKKDAVTIGRSEDADIPLDSAAVSRLHAKIRRQGTSWIIEETGSKNGLFVNGQVITVKPLKHGDTIEIAQHVLHWHRPDSELAEEKARASGKPGASFRLTASDVDDAISEKKAMAEVVRERLDSNMRTAYVSPEALEQMRAQVQTRRGAHLAALFTDGTRKEIPLDKDLFTLGWEPNSAIALPGRKWFGRLAATIRAVPGKGHEVRRHSFWTPVRKGGHGLAIDSPSDLADGELLEIGGNEFKYHPAVEAPKGARPTSTPTGRVAKIGKS